MRCTRLTTIAAVTALVHSSVLSGAWAQSQNWYASRATAAEIAHLPKFCLAQYGVAKGPEYEIRGCGAWMNHYCPALVDQMRANKSVSDRDRRLRYLSTARRGALYTLNGMKDYPQCPIRPHVEATVRLIDAQWRALGGK